MAPPVADRLRESPALGPWLERAAVALLLLAALVLRARQAAAQLDREYDGDLGAFFAIASVNYERFGWTRFHGYPALVLDVAPGAALADATALDALVYANHPPLVPLLAHVSLRLLGPRGWQAAWREGRAPEGAELALRLPFLLLHMAWLWLLHRLVRRSAGRSQALLALAIAAAMPITILYGSLVNYENATLPAVLLALTAYLGCASGARRATLGLAGAFLLATGLTWGAAFFLPPLVVHALLRAGPGRAARVALAGGLGIAVAVAAHHALAPAVPGAGVLERARILWSPLLDGSYPLGEWCLRQLRYARESAGSAVLVLAGLGLACALVPRQRRADGASPPPAVELAPLLVGGALLYFLAFYRHTYEPQRPFQLFLAPGLAVAAARALDPLRRPLLALRAGLAPHVLLVFTLLVPGLLAEARLARALRGPGPRDDASLSEGPPLALPRALGRTLQPLLPRGALGFVPAVLGTNLALPYYAWRNLWPAGEASGGLPAPLALSRYLAEAPRYWLLPERPPAGTEAAVGALRGALEQRGLVARASGGWLAYALPSTSAGEER